MLNRDELEMIAVGARHFAYCEESECQGCLLFKVSCSKMAREKFSR